MRPPLLLDAHQFLSTAAVGFASFHGLVLMGDRYVSFPLLAIVVPFTGSYEPLLVAFGQIAIWLSVLLIGSFHLRRHLGGQAWRRLHYASFVAFCLACDPRAGARQRERDPVGQPPVPGDGGPRDLPLPLPGALHAKAAWPARRALLRVIRLNGRCPPRLVVAPACSRARARAGRDRHRSVEHGHA